MKEVIMKILTVYANPNPKSFCHAVLEEFSRGLEDAGHENDVVDLYAIGFDPVLRLRDGPLWINESLPREILEGMNLKAQALGYARNGLERFAIKMALRNKSLDDILKMAWKRRPKDIVQQQQRVAAAQGLAFVAPVWFVGFPAILKGWVERVFTPGFAFGLSPEGWQGSLKGRIPLLKQEKVQIISTTLFDEAAYRSGLGDALKRLIDDFAFRYPGIREVEHTYFYAVNGVSADTRKEYLRQAYSLGKEF
jgi:NAD(P)H dehydrogenase (quinone)